VVAVDDEHKLIAEQRVTNQVLDLGLLTQTAASAKEILGGELIDVVADREYFKIEDIEACARAGMVPNVTLLHGSAGWSRRPGGVGVCLHCPDIG
jgi:transposase